MSKRSTFLSTIIAFTLLYSCQPDDVPRVILNLPPPTSGKYILFDADQDFNNGFTEFPSPYTAIYYANVDGTNVTRISPVEDGYYAYRPVWAPDGKQVLYIRGNQADNDRSICTIDLDGRHFKSGIIKGDEVDYASFSLDGDKIVYGKSLVHQYPYKYDIYVANRDGTSEKRITTFANQDGTIFNIHWASDGKIYFNLLNGAASGIYTISDDGSNLKYVSSAQFLLGISPDAKHILYDLGSGLYTSNNDGSNIKQIAAYDSEHPNVLVGGCWATDGTQVFVSNADYPANFGIFRMSSDGSNLKRILLGYYEYPSVF